MKKTLVALAVAAFATSASALTIYEQDGSKIDFDGSLRLRLDKESTKVDNQVEKRAHSNLHNNGSRFGVGLNHNLADDFYALGRIEFRFNKNPGGTDEFGDLYAHRAYVGLGSKQYGTLKFGRQVTIGDDIAQSGFDNYYGTFDGTLTTSGTSVVRYDYKGVEGLHIGLDYRFAEKRGTDALEKAAKDAVSKAEAAFLVATQSGVQQRIVDAQKELTKAQDELSSLQKGEVVNGSLKAGYGVGLVYNFAVAEGQSATLAAGYTRDHFTTGTSQSHHKDAYQFGAKYVVNALTLAADYAGSFAKNDSKTTRLNGFRVGAKLQATPAVALYTNYGRGVAKDKLSGTTTEERTYNKFMLGTSYQVHKNVFTYVEGGFGSVKTTKANNTVKKTNERNVAVGLNVSW